MINAKPVFHGSGSEIGGSDQVELRQRVGDAKVLLEVGERTCCTKRNTRREWREPGPHGIIMLAEERGGGRERERRTGHVQSKASAFLLPQGSVHSHFDALSCATVRKLN
jgi:hypothetical protein